jgi:hypothetical protein
MKRLADPDYAENQLRAQRAWLARNPDYWKTYRSKNLPYSESNRGKQQQRNRRQSIAKMDAAILPGIYVLFRPETDLHSAMEFVVEMKVLESRVLRI